MSNLPKGTGTPYIAIFDSSGAPIIDLLHNLPIGVFVTSFMYTYSEEDCDSAKVVIETNNTNISDHPSLQYLMPLKLQWGWIYPDGTKKSSPVRSVVVKDHKISFTNTGVKFTLDLSDSSFLLKKEQSDYSGSSGDLNKQGDYINYVEKVLSGTGQEVDVIEFKLTPQSEQSKRLKSQTE